MQMILTLFFLFITGLSCVFAAVPQCSPVSFKLEGKNILLPGPQHSKTPLIYFFQNKSLQSVWIAHPYLKNRGVSAGWASYLRPGNWSAVVLNKKNFSVSCSMIQPDKVEPLDCSKTLSICVPQNIVTAAPLEGNYWLADDKKWGEFLQTLEKRGVSFR
jgi:hypothetical protein